MRVFAEISRGRSLGWTLGATAISAVLLFWLGLHSPTSAAALFTVASVVSTLSVLALVHGLPRSRRRRRVGADGRGLSVDGALVVPRQTLARARVHVQEEPDGSHSIVVGTRGIAPPWIVHVGPARIAQALADTLQSHEETVAVFRALPPWAHRMRALTVLLTTSPWILVNVLRHLPRGTIFVVLGLYGLVALPLLLPQKVTIGEDGILLRWAGRRRFVPFGRLRAARATRLGVELEVLSAGRGDDGPRTHALEIRLSQRPDVEAVRREAMLERIERGLARSRALTPADDEALLARGERALDAWMEEMRALGSADLVGYRSLAMPRERLWAVLENPAADPSARQGALLALRDRLDDEERERLVAIAQKSASPHVRVAIDAVSTIRDTTKLRVAWSQVEGAGDVEEPPSVKRSEAPRVRAAGSGRR